MEFIQYVTDKAPSYGRSFILGVAAVGAMVLLAMVVLTCINIGLRPFGPGIRGALELSGYLCALGAGLCMPAAQLAGSHISAGIWAEKLPGWLHATVELLGNLVCAVLLLGIAWQLQDVGMYAYETDEFIDGFSFSYAFAAFGLVFGIFLHACIFLFKAVKLVSLMLKLFLGKRGNK